MTFLVCDNGEFVNANKRLINSRRDPQWVILIKTTIDGAHVMGSRTEGGGAN